MTVAADRRVHALTQLGRAMASTADFEEALKQLIVSISKLLDVETAGFMLFDLEQGQLILQQPAFGFSDPALIAAYRVPLSAGGNAVRVFTTQRPYMTNDAASDPRLLHEYVNLYNARNSITVPLVVEDQAIGVCHAINKRGDFNHDDVELLSIMAPLLAVSIQSASLFRDVREQRRLLERAVFLQAQLSRTAFDAQGMLPLAQRLAALVERPVMVLDAGLQPLAKVRWPEEVEPTPAWIDGTASSPSVVPIAVGANLGGYLAVLSVGQDPDRVEAGAIEHAATIFALEMLRERTAFEARSRVHSDLMSELFDGGHQDEGQAHRILADMGFTVAPPWRVGRLHIRWHQHYDVRWRQEVQPPSVRMHRELRDVCLELMEAAAAAPWRAGFLLLIPASPDDRAADSVLAASLLKRLTEIAQAIRPGSTVHLALSSPALTTSELRSRLTEAESGLSLARTLGVQDRPMLFEHLGVYQILLGGGGPLEHRRFIDSALGPVKYYDTEHGTQLLATLRGYIAADHNAAEAARQMYLHPNTLAYRLRTIRRLLAGDPSKGDLRLQVELALKLQDLTKLATSTAPATKAGSFKTDLTSASKRS